MKSSSKNATCSIRFLIISRGHRKPGAKWGLVIGFHCDIAFQRVRGITRVIAMQEVVVINARTSGLFLDLQNEVKKIKKSTLIFLK